MYIKVGEPEISVHPNLPKDTKLSSWNYVFIKMAEQKVAHLCKYSKGSTETKMFF